MQSFNNFVIDYKLLRFRWFGFEKTERIPKESRFDFLHVVKIRIKNSMGFPITYMDIKHSMTPDSKKTADMAFLTYFMRKRDRDDQNAPLGSKIHYHWLYLCYFPEIHYILNHFDTTESHNYMLRWGCLLDINPSFIELIHGTDGESAMYAIENIY